MKKKDITVTSPEVFVVIDVGKKQIKLEQWRYYAIVDELREAGVEQDGAYGVGKWALRAKVGDSIKAPGKDGTDVKISVVISGVAVQP